MRILSHRGYWKETIEKNTATAFERSFSLGFGTELDLRDHGNHLVVSHDPPDATALPAISLFEIYQRHNPTLPLALNIKADGLQKLVTDHLERFQITNAFVFDMSIPDTVGWIRHGSVPVFIRHSDIEPEPVLYREAAGVWLDGMHSDWWDRDDILRHLDAEKKICIVSPELHRREYRRVWDELAGMDLPATDHLMLCTDHPEQAKSVFSNDH